VTALLGIALALLAGAAAFAQGGPSLPEGSAPIGELHRGPNGEIEVMTPANSTVPGESPCDKGTLCVGQGQPYPTLAAALAAARDGDTIEVVAATYRESATIAHRNLTIRGVAGRPHFDCAGLALAGNKACLLIAADGVKLEQLEISGAELSDAKGANGACIRNQPDMSFTLTDVICHGSQDGILSNGGTIVIDRSEFYDNGWTGQTHNVYFNGDCTVTVRGSIFRDARVGHEFKSRCPKTTISDSTFRSTHGSRDLDIPDGGDTEVYGSTIEKDEGGESEEIIGFTPESCRQPADMILKDVHIINHRRDAKIHNFDKCDGRAIYLQGVTVEGILPILQGNIVNQGYTLTR